MAGQKNKGNFDSVRKIGLTFPGVEEGAAYGEPALKVNGRLLACMASHRSAEPGSLVVCVSFEDRDALIAEAPEIYYVKEHYLNYEPVLVRLSRINQTGDYDRARGLAGFLDRQRFFALELTNLCAMP